MDVGKTRPIDIQCTTQRNARTCFMTVFLAIMVSGPHILLVVAPNWVVTDLNIFNRVFGEVQLFSIT